MSSIFRDFNRRLLLCARAVWIKMARREFGLDIDPNYVHGRKGKNSAWLLYSS